MIIFLDLDGVLTNYYNVLPYGKISDRCPLDPQCVNWFNKLIEEFSFKIVLSSTWRKFYTIEEMNIKFRESGVKQEIYDFTPTRFDSVRGKEIQEWLDAHHEEKEYQIIDDEWIDIKPHHPKKNIIYVMNGWASNGFNKFHYNLLADRIKKITNIKKENT